MGSRTTASVCALTRYPCRARFDVVCDYILSFITVTRGSLDARTHARAVYVQDGHRRGLLEGTIVYTQSDGKPYDRFSLRITSVPVPSSF